MELSESIESINRQLIDEFGIDTITGDAMFRVVWSNEQREKRLVEMTLEGLKLMYPQVLEAKKYPWVIDRYVLERLVVIPEMNRDELPANKLSYEPIWVFRDNNDNYLPPRFDASKFVIDTMYAAIGKKSLRKYIDEEAKNPEEYKEIRVNKLCEELFGDENDVTDALAHGDGIVVPNNYERN